MIPEAAVDVLRAVGDHFFADGLWVVYLAGLLLAIFFASIFLDENF